MFRSYWDDGLLDVLAGVGVVSIGIFWAFDLVAIGAVVPGAVMLALFVGAYFLVRSRPDGLLQALVPGLPAFLLGLLAALAGWGLRLPRFLTYAGVLCLSGFGVALADARPEVAMLAGGIVFVAGGARRLHRLLQLPVEHAEEN